MVKIHEHPYGSLKKKVICSVLNDCVLVIKTKQGIHRQLYLEKNISLTVLSNTDDLNNIIKVN